MSKEKEIQQRIVANKSREDFVKEMKEKVKE